MKAFLSSAQDDFAAFLQHVFQWSSEETSQNAPLMFPRLAGAQVQPKTPALIPINIHADARGVISTPGSFAQASHAVGLHQHGGGTACHGLHQQQQWHTATTACVQPQLPLGMTHIPSTEESAALSAQILLLQAQHQEQLQAQQWQQHLHTLHPSPQQQTLHGRPLLHSTSTGEQHGAVGSAGSGSVQLQQQPQQHNMRRRGRPPKVSGKYSKGYDAMLRFREKRKSMMEQLERQVAEKQQLFKALQEENGIVASKFKALQGALQSQNRMIDQLAALNLSVGPVDIPAAAATHHASDNTAAPAAYSTQDLTGTGSRSWAGSAAYKQQLRALKKQELHKKHVQDAPALLARYRAYIQTCAAMLAQRPSADSADPGCAIPQRQQQEEQAATLVQGFSAAAAAAAASEGDKEPMATTAALSAAAVPAPAKDHTGFPPFPFDLVETLSLWKITRATQELQDAVVDAAATVVAPGRASGAGADGSSSPAKSDTRMLNQLTGKHDVVSSQFWALPSKQVAPRPQQRQQLQASWELYQHAIKKLNADRQQLRQQLQAAIDSPVQAEKLVQRLRGADAATAVSSTRTNSYSSVPMSANRDSALPTAAEHCSSVTQLESSIHDSKDKQNAERDMISVGMSGTVFAFGAEVPGCFAVQRLGNLPDLAQYEQLADAVERSLMRGRATVMAFGWSQLMLFDNEQIARIAVAVWPYFPLMRAIVGHMLETPEMQLLDS